MSPLDDFDDPLFGTPPDRGDSFWSSVEWRARLGIVLCVLTGVIVYFVSEANATFPTPTLTAWQRALYFTKANVPTFTIDSYAVKADALKLRTGNAMRYLERINRLEIPIDDRKPGWEATFEDVAISTKDFRAMVNGAGVALAVVFGVSAGNILTIAAGSSQIQPFSEGADGVDTMITVPATILRGSPDFSLTFT